MQNTAPITRESVIAQMQSQIDSLRACTNNDFILAYPDTGLGIRFAEPGKPIACSLEMAESIVPEKNNMPEEAWAFTPIVENGAGEKARIMPRQRAIALHIPHLEDCIASLTVAA